MIASLHGKIDSIGGDWVIINVNGIAFQVCTPTTTLSTLGHIGEEVKLYTHLHIREDNVTLYGFASSDELRLFETLMSVSGIGPRLGLAMLSVMSVEQLTTCIATSNVDMLTGVPGIGKKTANRIILELKDKITAGWVILPMAQKSEENTEILAALTSLGYSIAEANQALVNLPSSSSLSLEEKIKQALQYFGRK